MNDEFFASVYNKALDIISRREHSKHELKNKLLKKFDIPDLIDEVITKLIENNLINDSRYAQMYVLVRKRKGFGPKKIEFELMWGKDMFEGIKTHSLIFHACGVRGTVNK